MGICLLDSPMASLLWLFMLFLPLLSCAGALRGVQVCEVPWLGFRNSYPGVEGEGRRRRRNRREMRKNQVGSSTCHVMMGSGDKAVLRRIPDVWVLPRHSTEEKGDLKQQAAPPPPPRQVCTQPQEQAAPRKAPSLPLCSYSSHPKPPRSAQAPPAPRSCRCLSLGLNPAPSQTEQHPEKLLENAPSPPVVLVFLRKGNCERSRVSAWKRRDFPCGRNQGRARL